MAEHKGPGGHGGFQKPKDAKQTVRRLLPYLTRSKLPLVGVALCLVLSVCTNLIASYYMNRIVLNNIVDGVYGDPAAFLVALVPLVTAYLAGMAATYIQSAVMVQLAQRGVNRLRSDLFAHLQTLPLAYFDAHPHGELMSRFSNDADNVQMAMEQSLVSLLSSALLFVGIIGVMIFVSPVLFLVSVLVLTATFLVFKTFGSRSRKSYRQQQEALGEMNGNIQEIIEGLKVVKAFTHEREAREQFDALNETYRAAAVDANFYSSAIMPVSMNIINMGYALTAAVGGALAIVAGFDLGGFVLYLQLCRQVGQPMSQISQQLTAVLSALAGAERIFNLMDAQPETDEGTVTLVSALREEDGSLKERCDGGRSHLWAWKVPQPDGGAVLVELRGDVRLRDVEFAYVEGKSVLRGISLYAKPGQKIAFVGSTGAGKTTVTNLLTRFYEIQRGTITYDGIDVRDIRKDALRASLGMVLQDTHLFTGTVMENIRYGRLDATDEACIAAAKSANAHAFIRRLPQGYDTPVVGDGVNLSQGQRQLLAIARAAVADPPVMILDEATSSIDTRTERLIEQGMNTLMEGRTVFVIAHRLSTVRNSNAIMVVEGGEIIERGDHDDLIAQKGRYYQLYTGLHQLS